MKMIDYREVSSDESIYSKLFIDYVTDYSKLQGFFPGNFRSDKDWKERSELASERRINRAELVRILSRQNRNFQCGVKTLVNIDLLANDNAVAVVTGQQVGMGTGPLYTIYKTITAILLSEHLHARFPEYNYVPVFWLESEDHDLAEMSGFDIASSNNELVNLAYNPEMIASGKNLGAVGSLTFQESGTTRFIDQLKQSLSPTEFTPKLMELIQETLRPSMTFTKSFVYLLSFLFEDRGIVFIDPNDPDVKRLLAPFFRKELNESPQSCQLVIEQSIGIEAQYHAQVKPKPVNLFMFHNGGRFSIEPHPQGFSLKNTRQHFSKEQLLDLLDQTPEVFSPNVVLRPICQDALLPTVAYVAGPSEIAYFAQLYPLYQYFGIHQPLIYPRASVTIVEEKVDKVLARFGLQPWEFFQDIELIKQRIAAQVSDFKAEELFGSTIGTIEESLNSLRSGMQKLDPTLLGALDNTLAKIRGNVDGLREKTIAAQKRQHEVYLRQIDKAGLFLFPNGKLQERVFNVVYFLNKYGFEFTRWLTSELVIDKFKHQFLTI